MTTVGYGDTFPTTVAGRGRRRCSHARQHCPVWPTNREFGSTRRRGQRRRTSDRATPHQYATRAD
ncbi:MAG: hypothetical protein ACJ789_08615 [Thermomicrobiales bacterium]